MASLDELRRRASLSYAEIETLRQRLSHAQNYTDRNSLQRRIRTLQDRMDSLYRQYLKAQNANPVSVFGTKTKPRVRGGMAVRMDISVDGVYFSNPAPSIANGQRVWVRLIIDMAQRSPFSTAKTIIPERIRTVWVVPRGWTKLDNFSRFGRDEYVSSIPLIVTHEFKAPSSGSTRANFGCYVDPYYYVEPTNAPDLAGLIDEGELFAVFEPGTYRIWTLLGETLGIHSDVTLDVETKWKVDDGDEEFLNQYGGTSIVRLIQSGPYSGRYVDTDGPGIALDEDGIL
jgi:hypothetical protein